MAKKKFSQTRTELYPSENILLRELLGVWKLRKKRDRKSRRKKKLKERNNNTKQVKPKKNKIHLRIIDSCPYNLYLTWQQTS